MLVLLKTLAKSITYNQMFWQLMAASISHLFPEEGKHTLPKRMTFMIELASVFSKTKQYIRALWLLSLHDTYV